MPPGPYAEVSDNPASARALPGRAYADPQVFAVERERVLAAGWLPVARESEVARAGDCRPADPLGTPLMVTRDENGALHVLSRVCRHRGMLIAPAGSGERLLTCPYHLWRYRLDGVLTAAPAMEGKPLDGCALKHFAHETWGGWVFVNLDGQAAPLAPQLGPLAERLAPIDPAGFVTATVLAFDSPWNWKVMVENFMESYHHIGTHAESLQRTNPGLGTWARDEGEAYAILENPPAPGAGALLVAAVFPLTLMFFSERDPAVGGWYEFADLAHDRFTLRIHVLARPDVAASPQFVEGVREGVTAIHLEDISACEGVQRGVTSDGYEPGPLSRLEGCLWRFHRYLKGCFS